MKKYLNLEYLNTFLIAAETRKLNVTAEITFRSASAVSTQIKNLEEQLGKPLFIRNKNMLTITKEGELLAKYAEKLLTLNNSIFSEINNTNPHNTVVFGIPTDYTKLFTEELFPAIQNEFPQFHYSISSSRSREIRRMLNEGKAQAAILALEPQYHNDLCLWEEALYWASSKEYNIASSTTIPIAIFSDNCVLNNYAQFCLEKVAFSYEVRYRSISMDNIAQFVSAGLAIALLPESMITKEMSILPTEFITCPYSLKVGFTYTQDLPTDIARRMFTIIQKNLEETGHIKPALSMFES